MESGWSLSEASPGYYRAGAGGTGNKGPRLVITYPGSGGAPGNISRHLDPHSPQRGPENIGFRLNCGSPPPPTVHGAPGSKSTRGLCSPLSQPQPCPCTSSCSPLYLPPPRAARKVTQEAGLLLQWSELSREMEPGDRDCGRLGNPWRDGGPAGPQPDVSRARPAESGGQPELETRPDASRRAELPPRRALSRKAFTGGGPARSG